jgi:hypothetical protein
VREADTVDTDGPGDPRFTVRLAIDVAHVITQHGYDELNGGQVVEPQGHIFHLLHGDPEGHCQGGRA